MSILRLYSDWFHCANTVIWTLAIPNSPVLVLPELLDHSLLFHLGEKSVVLFPCAVTDMQALGLAQRYAALNELPYSRGQGCQVSLHNARTRRALRRVLRWHGTGLLVFLLPINGQECLCEESWKTKRENRQLEGEIGGGKTTCNGWPQLRQKRRRS